MIRIISKWTFASTVAAPVQVDFDLILNERKELYEKIEEAYSDDGLGVMVINNIPNFKEKWDALLPLA